MSPIRHRSSTVLLALGAVCLVFGLGTSAASAEDGAVTDAATDVSAAAEPEAVVDSAGEVTAAAFVVTVTPTVGLSDGDDVTVNFSGAGTTYPVSAFLCSQETAGGAAATFVCDVANAAAQTAMGPSGTITIQNVHDGNVGSTGTCTTTCKIMAADNSTATMVWTNITFGQPATTTTTQATTTTTATDNSTTSTTVAGSTTSTTAASTTATTAVERARSVVQSAGTGRSLAATGAGTGALAVLAGLLLLVGAVLVRTAERRKAPSRTVI